MNQYTEALMRIMLDGKCDTSKINDKDLNLLLQLFKRAEPMFTDSTECPNCDGWNAESEEYFTPHKFCPDCGQALKRVK